MSKLVRDKIPDIIRRKGKVPVTHTADAKEYNAKLNEKLQEEVAEFLQDGKIEELVDILEVVYAIADNLKIRQDELETLRRTKADKNGRFKEKIILDSTSFIH